MTITAFADAATPFTLQPFYRLWHIDSAFVRPVSVRCARCNTVLELLIAADTALDDHDTKIFLLFEVLHRGWNTTAGVPRCPPCRAKEDDDDDLQPS